MTNMDMRLKSKAAGTPRLRGAAPTPAPAASWPPEVWSVLDRLQVAVWVEDYSKFLRELRRLRARRVKDLARYLARRPEAVGRLVRAIRVLRVNKAAVALYAAPSDKALMESLEAVFTSATTPAFIAHACAIWGGEKVFAAEETVRTLDGRELTVLVSMLLPSLDDEVAIVPVSVQDITDRKRALDALRDSEERARITLDNAQIGLVRVRASDGKVEKANRRFAEIFGYEDTKFCESELVLSRLYVDPSARMCMLRKVREDGRIDNFETRLYRRDGAIIWVRFSARAADDGQTLVGVVADITAEKQALDALRESEAQYRTLVEHIAAITYTVEIEGAATRLWVSGQTETLLGYPPETFTGNVLAWIKRIHADDRRDVIRALRRSRETLEPLDLEYRFVARDGEIKWLRDRRTLVRPTRDDPLTAHGLIVDITEKKRLQAVADESEARYRLLVDNIPAITSLLRIDDGTERLWMSRQTEQMVGYPPEAFKDSVEAWYDKVHPDDQQHVREALRRSRKARSRLDIQYRFIARDGAVKWLRESSTYDRSAPKGSLIAQSVFYDITDEKAAADALRKSESRYALALAAMNDGVWEWNFETRQGFVSPRLREMIGAGDEDIVHSRNAYLDLFHQDDRRRLRKAFRTLLKDRAPYDVEARLRRGDGSYLWVRARGQAEWDTRGRAVRVAGAITDISRRKRADALLARKSRADDALARVARTILTGDGHSLDEVCDQILAAARELTDSEFGFVGYIDPETGYLACPTLTKDVWGACKVEGKGFVFREWRGLFGWVLDNGQPLLTNDAPNDPRSKGIPAGHLPIRKFLSAPARSGKELVGQIAVANSARDYDDLDLATIRQFADLHALAIRDRRARAEVETMARFPAENPNPVLRIDRSGKVLSANPAAQRIMQANQGDEEADAARWQVFLARLAAATAPFQADIQFNGRIFEFDVAPVAAMGYVNLYGRDITSRKETERLLALQGAAMASAANAIFISDRNGRIQWVNQAFERLSGFTAKEAIGRTPRILKSGRQSRKWYADMWKMVLDGKVWRGHLVNRHKDGHLYDVEQTVTPIKDEDGRIRHFVTVHEDVTAQVAARERILHMATHDSLTDLPNRTLFRERLVREIPRVRRETLGFAVLFLDLDHFKDVNDSLGHPIGDELLQAVARRLSQSVREIDTVARFGGDEFAVLQTGLHEPGDAAVLAQKIIDCVAEPFFVGGFEIRSGTSIGIAVCFDAKANAETLMEQADTALYQTKDERRGTYRFFTPEMGEALRREVMLANELGRAIEKDELFLVYQPQIDVATRHIVGLEALVRWRRASCEVVPPGDFIAMAESHGMIGKLGEWVLREACRQGREWLAAGVGPERISVNMSPIQFREPDIAARVFAILDDIGFPPLRLELELTETVFMGTAGQYRDAMDSLTRRGITFAIDDFGTGYSSLLYLKELDIRKLKIAQEFVRDMLASRRDAAIVRTTIALARNLGLVAVAEGAETIAQLGALREAGCHQIQGYVFSRPLEAAEATELLKKGTCPPAA